MSVSPLPSALVEAFRAFAADGGSAVDGALLVSRIVKPDTNGEWCRLRLSELAEAVPAEATPEALVHTLRDEGFSGASEGYYRPENSSIEHVLEHRGGLPIALGVIVIGVAECLGLDAAGVNFPRRFLVTLGDALVDPFEMALTSESECRAWLRQELRGADGASSERDADAAFRRAGPTDITLRMLNNLRMLRQSRQDPGYALALTDCQLMLKPGDCGLHIDRADIWLSLGSLEMARQELAHALEHASPRAKAHIDMRLKALPEGLSGSVN